MTTLEKIRAEVKNIVDFVAVNGGIYVREYDVVQIIDKYAEQEPCDDAISREDAIHAFDYLMGLNRAQIQDTLFKLPSVTPKLIECEDAVSRQAVLDVVEREPYKGDALSEIEKLPSVRPQEQTGHWIYDRTRDWDGECKYECSECGMGSDVDYAYCMRCGAKMVKPRESEVSE